MRLSVEGEPSSVTVSPCRGAELETVATATGAIPVTSTDTPVVSVNPSASVTVNLKLSVSTVFGAVKLATLEFEFASATDGPDTCLHS